jgi:hypothetical protein
MIRRALLTASLLGLFTLPALPALADCSSPAGVEGHTRYDFTAHGLFVCTGTNWIDMSGSGGGSSQWTTARAGKSSTVLSPLWRGISIQVSFDPDPHGLGDGYAQIDVQTQDLGPLPITESGYLSVSIPQKVIDEYGGPVLFVTTWCDERADTREWKAAEADRRQGRLF